ncbi:EpsG family protein [Flavobacterium poyangense]|uniref:EpsG family protein n=1 Tax=Flavobacterium poyangense TaxID=2204302 RepID=UPI0014206474|nr:EpsG family protein [Flavobacterium sp. JXAS1]
MALYKILFYIIYSIAAFFAVFTAINIDFKKRNYQGVASYIVLVLMFAYVFLFGLRAIDVGTDTEMYHWQYTHHDEITYGTDAPVGYMFKFLNIFSENPQIFLFIMSFLYVTLNFYALKKYTKFYKSNFFLSVFSLISLFFFESLGINVIRQGLSLAFFVLAIIYRDFSPKKKFKWISFLVLAVCFHFTSLIPVVIYLSVAYFKKIRMNYYYCIYIASVFLSAASISILSFKEYFIGFLLIDERRSGYLDADDSSYLVGFKPQFVAFNTIFLILFVYLNKIEKNDFYTNLLKYYIVISSIFYMMFQIPYSDRWGVMSWCVIPILFSPMFKVYQSKKSIKALFSILFLIFIFVFFQSR